MSQASNSAPSRQQYFVALGANLPSSVGAPRDTLVRALKYTEQYSCKVINIGRLFSCPAFPAGNGPDYVNTAALLEGPGEPKDMLTLLQDIEIKLGRTRDVRWGQRTLDLDLIAAGDLVLPDEATHTRWRTLQPEKQRVEAPEDLILPHPRMQDRAFVLVPLADIAPDWVHPTLGRTVREMRDALPAEVLAELVPLD